MSMNDVTSSTNNNCLCNAENACDKLYGCGGEIPVSNDSGFAKQDNVPFPIAELLFICHYFPTLHPMPPYSRYLVLSNPPLQLQPAKTEDYL